jgi:2-oxoglutarate ferredoxin oxidoreductase subunit gamma
MCMKAEDRVTIQFCGFGGQGIVLSSVVFGTAAVTRAGLNGVQTQSYGSEARGGECQAELILSKGPINSPLAENVDILVAMSQSALDKYLDRLRPGGVLIIDSELVDEPESYPKGLSEVRLARVPATRMASDLGSRIAANMVMLGFLQQSTGLLSEEALTETIADNVPAKSLELNLEAAAQGMALARDTSFRAEL